MTAPVPLDPQPIEQVWINKRDGGKEARFFWTYMGVMLSCAAVGFLMGVSFAR